MREQDMGENITEGGWQGSRGNVTGNAYEVRISQATEIH